MLQCVAVCCSVLQCVAVCCSALHSVLLANVNLEIAGLSLLCALQCVAVIFQYVAVCCSALQCVAACCSVLQRVAVYCSELLAIVTLEIAMAWL